MRDRRGALLGLGLVLCCAACPADDATGGGETGGEVPPPDPMDPFDGEGSDPPGDPDETLVWRPPSSLGNGMVHDSRFDLAAGSFERQFTPAELAAGVDWAEFVDSHRQKRDVGFRPTQVDAELELSQGIDGNFVLAVSDRSVYVSDDDANYRTKIVTHVFGALAAEQALSTGGPVQSGDPRPTSVDTFAFAQNAHGVSIVWTYDRNPVAWQLVVGQDKLTFTTTFATLADKGYRPISIASRRRAGLSEYAAIFIRDGMPAEDWRAMLGHDALQLAAAASEAWDEGYYPFRGGYEQGSEGLPLFHAIWTRRSPGLSLEMRYNMDEVSFAEQDQYWRGRGLHLESATGYFDAGVRRYAGLWVRHQPYLRWDEAFEVDPMDPTYLARYAPFHDQVIQLMTLEGDGSEGEFFRPSSTLHIYDQGQLVLDRAYTYAPGVYPDTPLDAPMALASASKSITAAAVVMEMNAQGLPLTTPFATAAGINGVPSMAAVPTVLDVLRMLGGFNADDDVDSYLDHSIIDASIYGAYPISGEMMYDYVVLGGHLDVGGADSYWDSGIYNMDQQSSQLRYSNPGYSMLGQLLRVQSGLPSYEDYMRTKVLAPLNLQQEIFPDPGHRNGLDAPTKVGLRSYLINDRHPYIVTDCSTDADCSYLACQPGDQNCSPPVCGPDATCLGCSLSKPCQPGWDCVGDECVNLEVPRLESEPVPKPASRGDGSPSFRVNTGPIDVTAPVVASKERYAGQYYMGGAPLAAGGYYADGKSLALLTRVITESELLMPQAVAAQLWNPLWWNGNHNRGPGWSYGLGWWVRGNWVAMAGGTNGVMSLALHNLAYDFTVVYSTNVKGNPLGDLLGPLMTPVNLVWGTSTLGQQFPCVDDFTTPQPECQGAAPVY